MTVTVAEVTRGQVTDEIAKRFGFQISGPVLDDAPVNGRFRGELVGSGTHTWIFTERLKTGEMTMDDLAQAEAVADLIDAATASAARSALAPVLNKCESVLGAWAPHLREADRRLIVPAEELAQAFGGQGGHAVDSSAQHETLQSIVNEWWEDQSSDSKDALRDEVPLMRGLPHEVFACLFLDTRHRVIAFEELFRGTLDGAEVHPREVVQRCLAHHAAAVILGHNHPSGCTEPSAADRAVTARLRQALGLVEVRLLDHFIVGDGPACSMARLGAL